MFDPIDTLGPIWTPDPVVRSHPLNRGRVAWWLILPGLDGGKFFYDLMGLYPGTLTNMTTAASGWRGTTQPGGSGHLLFDGSDDSVALASPISLPGAFTVAGWFRDDALSNARVYVGGNGTADFSLIFDATQVFIKVAGTLANTVHSQSLTAGSWRQWAVTRNAANLVSWYLDGRPVATPLTLAGTHTIDHLGSYGNGTANYLGAMNDIGVWNRAFSAADVWSLYDLSRRGYPGVLRRWPGMGAAMMTPTSTYPGAFAAGLADHAPPYYAF